MTWMKANLDLRLLRNKLKAIINHQKQSTNLSSHKIKWNNTIFSLHNCVKYSISFTVLTLKKTPMMIFSLQFYTLRNIQYVHLSNDVSLYPEDKLIIHLCIIRHTTNSYPSSFWFGIKNNIFSDEFPTVVESKQTAHEI